MNQPLTDERERKIRRNYADSDPDGTVPLLLAQIDHLRAELDAEKSAHRFTLRQRNNRSNRLLHLRDLALAGDTEALLAAAKDTLAASRHDHDDCAASVAAVSPAAEETHVVADDSDDPEHVDNCPGCAARLSPADPVG